MKGLRAGMNGQYSWKRTEEAEIDLADLMRGILGRWKQIAVCALLCSVIFGGYRWMKERNASAASELVQEEILLTEAEEQGVADALQLESEIRGLEAYLDSSVLMQIDPYHKNKCIMLYCIDQAERQNLPQITESYLNFVLNGGAADALKKSAGSNWKIDKNCIAELISAYQKTYSYPYQVVVDSLSESSMMTDALFYVEIVGRNAKEAEQMAADLQAVLKQRSSAVKEEAGKHRLKLVSTTQNVLTDSGLQVQQHDKKALLSSNKNSLRAMTDAFSKEQMAVYQEACGADENSRQEEHKADVSYDNSGMNIKYIFLGFLGGIFAYCGFFVCWYFFNDVVKSTEEMRRMYTFHVYGGIPLGNRGRKHAGKGKAVQKDIYEIAELQVLNRIRLVCQKQGITKLCAAVDFALTLQEKECLENMAKQLHTWGIGMTVFENASKDTGAWDSLAENGNILMVCRTGWTTHRMIDDAMYFYLENGISVMGAVAFLQNK